VADCTYQLPGLSLTQSLWWMFLDSHYKRLIEVGGVGTHLHQWVSNLSVQRKLLQLVKAHSTGSCPRVSDSVALVRSRIYICNQFPGDGMLLA
jgi:hypothetical protein